MRPIALGIWSLSLFVGLISFGGRMREFAKGFYRTIVWQNVRNDVMVRDHWLCQDCLDAGLIVPADEVHHIIPLTPENISNPDISLNPSNLVALCRECHKKRHQSLTEQRRNIGSRARRRFTVDEWGHVRSKIDEN